MNSYGGDKMWDLIKAIFGKKENQLIVGKDYCPECGAMWNGLDSVEVNYRFVLYDNKSDGCCWKCGYIIKKDTLDKKQKV